MTKKLNLSVNDLVVRYGKVLKVFEVDKDTVSLQPFFEKQSGNGLTFTINLTSVNDGSIRKLDTKAKIKQLQKDIIKKSLTKEDCPAFDSKTALSLNQLEDTLWTVKALYIEKQEKAGVLLGGKLSTFKNAIQQASQEFAAINNTMPEKEHDKILLDLASSLK